MGVRVAVGGLCAKAIPQSHAQTASFGGTALFSKAPRSQFLLLLFELVCGTGGGYPLQTPSPSRASRP